MLDETKFAFTEGKCVKGYRLPRSIIRWKIDKLASNTEHRAALNKMSEDINPDERAL
jgi:hypothetical protein